MKKIVYVSEIDMLDAMESDVDHIWYTVVNNEKEAIEACSRNPWNGINAITTGTLYLLDDCVLTIRPARSVQVPDSNKDFCKNRYFIEISNQDGSICYSSYKNYSWDDAIKHSSLFKGLSFNAAVRVWGIKKL